MPPLRSITSFLLVLFYSQDLYAYLDPGSGSLILYLIAGLLSAGIYSLKFQWIRLIETFRIKFRAGDAAKSAKNIAAIGNLKTDIVLHIEGPQYWNTFLPIIEHLEGKDVSVTCIGTGIDGESLPNDKSGNIEVISFDKDQETNFFMGKIKAPVVASTTPQLDVYMLRRSPKVGHYTHIFHAPTDAAFYEKHAFDYYDSIFCVGPFHHKSIRRLESLRGMPEKKLLEGGCPYYDIVSRNMKAGDSRSSGQQPLLYAPSWGKRSSLIKFGTDVFDKIRATGNRIIFRPHPQLFISHKEFMEDVEKYVENHPAIEWDRRRDISQSLLGSRAMISDMSGVIFDYAFLGLKPVILFDCIADFAGFEAEDLEEVWEVSIRSKIGRVTSFEDLSGLNKVIEAVTDANHSEDWSGAIRLIRDQQIYNFASAGPAIGGQLINLAKGTA